jgi:hypothetical protein
MTKQPDPAPRPDETPERDYEPPAAEEVREDYPLETAAGTFTFK